MWNRHLGLGTESEAKGTQTVAQLKEHRDVCVQLFYSQLCDHCLRCKRQRSLWGNIVMCSKQKNNNKQTMMHTPFPWLSFTLGKKSFFKMFLLVLKFWGPKVRIWRTGQAKEETLASMNLMPGQEDTPAPAWGGSGSAVRQVFTELTWYDFLSIGKHSRCLPRVRCGTRFIGMKGEMPFLPSVRSSH